jgi:hypothetical protein
MNRLRDTAFRVWCVLAICALLWSALLPPSIAQAPSTQGSTIKPTTTPEDANGKRDRMKRQMEDYLKAVRDADFRDLLRRDPEWPEKMRLAILNDTTTSREAKRVALLRGISLELAVKDNDFLRAVEDATRNAHRIETREAIHRADAMRLESLAQEKANRESLVAILLLAIAIAHVTIAANQWHRRRTRLMVFWQLMTPGLTWILYPALQVVGRYENQSTILAVVCAASPTIVTLLLCLRDAILGSEKPADTTAAAAQSPAPVPPVSGDGSDPAG